MRYLNVGDTRKALPMGDAIEAVRHAFTGESETPLRSLVGGSLVMPGRLDDIIAVKVVSVVPGTPAGLVVVFGGDGGPLGLVDGPTLTAIRTGAVCGLATSLLAPEAPVIVAMLGSGAMAYDQVEAIKTVRLVTDVRVWSRSLENAERLAKRVGGSAVLSADEAVAGADVVSCATPSTEPLFSATSVNPGTHVNAVGAFTPEMVELPPDLVREAYVVVEDLDAAAAEAGDLIQAGRGPTTTMRELVSGDRPETPEKITIFKSVGVAALDVAAAARALANAERDGIGVVLR